MKADVEFRNCTLEEILPLRQKVLRDGIPLSARFSGDEDPSTRHFAGFRGPAVVACVTYLASNYQGEPAWQLRGMAVDPVLQTGGLGQKLFRVSLDELSASSEIRFFWCNARTSAKGFYEKLGWKIDSEEFLVDHIGPHFIMVYRVQP